MLPIRIKLCSGNSNPASGSSILVGVAVAPGAGVLVGVLVGAKVPVGVFVGVLVGTKVPVGVLVGTKVPVGVGVGVLVGASGQVQLLSCSVGKHSSVSATHRLEGSRSAQV